MIIDMPTTVQQGGVGLGYVRVMQAKGKQDRRRVMSKATRQSTVAHSTNKHKLGTVGKG